MAKFTAYYLEFKGNLHLGDVRADYGNTELNIHSDTLQAAIIAALAAIGKAPEDGHLPFALTSMFPFYHEMETSTVHHFFPKPIVRLESDMDTSEISKKIKKIKWVDQYYFEGILNGKVFPNFGNNGDDDFQGTFLHNHFIGDPIYYTQTIPRASIPRTYIGLEKVNTQIFYMEVIRFRPKAGFYFLAEGSPDSLKLLEKALSVLEDEGFGTDRTVGNGHFTWSKSEIIINAPTRSEYITNLSLYCPPSQELLLMHLNESDIHIAYDLLKRGGWITSASDLGIRKRFVYMISEGSILWNCLKPESTNPIFISGSDNINVKPLIPVKTKAITRSGKAIFLPINFKNNG